jgi:fructokinase
LSNEIIENKQSTIPQIIGSGLITLDVIMAKSKRENKIINLQLGGTCGNVLTILSYLGWNSYPILRLNNTDDSTKIIVNEMEKWGVKADFLLYNKKDTVPVIVENIYLDKEPLKHSFSFNCPNCRNFLPRFRAATLKQIKSLENKIITQPAVFFYDRVSAGNVKLAKKFAEKGTLVVFEPPKDRNSKLFKKALKNCHILKYSNQRNGKINSLIDKENKPDLEVITLGDEGLEYRANFLNDDWKRLEPYNIDQLKDSAGAGDWCTAGLIHSIGRNGRKGFLESDSEKIESALNLGQTLAVLNCAFYGARGVMYQALNQKEILSIFNEIMLEKINQKTVNETKKPIKRKISKLTICKKCGFTIDFEDLLEDESEAKISKKNLLINLTKIVDNLITSSVNQVTNYEIQKASNKDDMKIQVIKKNS